MASREVRSVNKKLTEDERQRHRRIRKQIEQERAELVAYGTTVRTRHDTPRQAVAALKAARQALGLTLTDIRARTGIEKSNLSRLENDPNPNPTIDTLCRYADAVGKEIAITLVEKSQVETRENEWDLHWYRQVIWSAGNIESVVEAGFCLLLIRDILLKQECAFQTA